MPVIKVLRKGPWNSFSKPAAYPSTASLKDGFRQPSSPMRWTPLRTVRSAPTAETPLYAFGDKRKTHGRQPPWLQP